MSKLKQKLHYTFIHISQRIMYCNRQNRNGTFGVTGRAHCQRQVAFFFEDIELVGLILEFSVI